jgi:hypothetical protein
MSHIRKREFFLGLDLGQRRDRTAIAVIERAEILAPHRDPITWAPITSLQTAVRFLQRMPLHTPYTAISEHVIRIGRQLAALGQCTLAVDATGVGLPVVDALKIVNAPWRLMPVTIGSAAHEYYSDGFWRVPKRDLIASLQLAFENHAFRIAGRLRESQTLIEELASMRATTRLSGHTQFASPGAAHDDLAIALALSWWAAHTRRPGELGVNKPLI